MLYRARRSNRSSATKPVHLGTPVRGWQPSGKAAALFEGESLSSRLLNTMVRDDFHRWLVVRVPVKWSSTPARRGAEYDWIILSTLSGTAFNNLLSDSAYTILRA